MLKIPKSECSDARIRLPRHTWPKSWEKIEDPVVPVARNLYGHPSAGLLWERQFEQAVSELGWEKIPNWECVFVHRKQGLLLSVYVDDINVAGKKQNVAPMWKKLIWNVDIDEFTSFLDHVDLGCTQRERKPNEATIEQHTKKIESRVSAGATGENYRDGKDLTHKPLRGPTTWKDMLKNALSDTVNLQTTK